MYIKQRLLRGGAPRALTDLLVCGADGNGDGGAGGDDDAKKALDALTKKNAELLDETKKTKARLRELEAAEEERATKLREAEDEKARAAKDVEKLEAGWKEKHSKAEGDALLWRSKYETLVIDGGLSDALDGIKINPALKKAALAMLKSEHGVDLDDNGAATIDGKPLKDFVGEWAKSETGKAFVINGNAGGGAGGSGNGGSGGGGGDVNPWDPKTRNLTQQGVLLRTDRAKAVQMAAQHGVKL